MAHKSFGSPIPNEAIDDGNSFVGRDTCGYVLVDDVWAPDLFKDIKVQDWPYGSAPKVAREFLESLRASVQNFTKHNMDFSKKSGLSEHWSWPLRTAGCRTLPGLR
mmetsp:Transcript_69119/g.224153  ORF Transcript_69119/g.224153 Transcript_69119/m.224153 type:complete len:106 (+) Transcript_69119:378-695(+)